MNDSGESDIDLELDLEKLALERKTVSRVLRSHTKKSNLRNLPYPKMATNNADPSASNQPTVQLQNIVQNSDVTTLTAMLPEFKPGDSLSTFITAVDNLADYFSCKLNPNQLFIFNISILSKIKEGARDYLNFHNVTDWNNVKDALLRKYGDQRDEEILLSELRNTVQKRNESYTDYYDRLIRSQNDLMQFVQLHEKDATIKNFKRTFYQRQTLQIFCSGINDPYHDFLMHFELNSLEDALNKCKIFDNKTQAHQYMKFVKQTQEKPITRPHLSKPPIRNDFMPKFSSNFCNTDPPNVIRQQNQNSVTHSQQPSNFARNSVIRSAKFNAPTTRTFQNNSNNSTQRRQYQPTPMSVQTINSNHNRSNNAFTARSRPAFVSQELFNNETAVEQEFAKVQEIINNEDDTVPLEYVEDEDVYDEETENFRLDASE